MRLSESHARSILVLAIMLLGVACSAGVSFYVATVTSPEEFGTYSIVLSLIAFMSLYSSHSNGLLIVRYLPGLMARKDGADKFFLVWSLRSVVLRSLLVFLFCSAIALILGEMAGLNISSSYYWAAFLVVPFSLVIYAVSVKRCHRLVFAALFPFHVLRYLVVAAIVLAMALYSVEIGADELVLVEVVSLFSILVFMLCSSISIFSFSFGESLRGHREDVLEWKKRGWSFFGASLSQQLLTSADIFLVGVFFGTENAAVYALASRISKASVIGNKAVNEYLSPAISSAFFQKDNERIKRMFYYSCYVALAFSLLYVMFFIFVKDYIASYFSFEYNDIILVSSILLAGQFVNSATGATGILLSLTNRENINSSINVISALFMIISMFSVSCYYDSALAASGAYSIAIVLSAIAKFLVVLWGFRE